MGTTDGFESYAVTKTGGAVALPTAGVVNSRRRFLVGEAHVLRLSQRGVREVR